MNWPMYRADDDAAPGEGQGSFTNSPNLPSERTKAMTLRKPAEPIDAEYDEVIETEDGGVIVRLGGPELLERDDDEEDDTERDEDEAFYGNLAEHMDESDLALLAEDLIQGIDIDLQKMSTWVANYERGISLLGIEVKQPRGEVSGEGVSQVDHPLLLDACLGGASNALAEMLPAAGPVKIDNSGRPNAVTDKQAAKLEKAFNEFITVKSPEYYPDTDRMIFQWYFGGMGFKKVFHCPLRRRPVSDSIAPGDLIVSNDATSITSAGRKTHRSKLRQSVMARMQYVGAYRKVDLQLPTDNTTGIERKVGNVQGVQQTSDRVEDTEYTIYETCVDYDMPGDEHVGEDGEPTGLPRPYIVTIERDTRTVLEVRRNWRRDDENFAERRRIVAYQLIPMFGFYASGLLNVLANSTTALTAAWRIMLDNGMFANFPGFLYAKNGDRQMDNNFRVGPGEGAGIDIGGADDIRKTIMNLPYKEFGPAFPAFVDKVQETARQVGGRADIPVAEGKANAPVGTTLAALEQASLMISAIHKRGHMAQAEEFSIWLELIREDPESFVRLFADDEDPWEEQELLDALENYRLIPRSDPNTPTQMHRLLKGSALKQMADGAPDRYDADKVDTFILEMLGFEDPQQFFSSPEQRAAQAQQPGDPSLAIANKVAETKIADTAAKKEIADLNAKVKVIDIRSRDAIAKLNASVKIADIEAREQSAAEDRTQHGALELYKAQSAEQQHAIDAERSDADAAANRDVTLKTTEMKDKTAREGFKARAQAKPKGPAK
jgi:hypothetical protein